MKFSKWFLVGLGAFVVIILSCELVSRAEVDTGTPSPAVAVPDSYELALDQCEQDLVACQMMACQIDHRALEIECVAGPNVCELALDQCSQDLVDCQIQQRSLEIEFMADRVSMREVEMCPGFAAFMETCRGE